MKIGMLGTGEVAHALAVGFFSRGHEVKFGTRDPESDKAKALVARVPKSTIGTFAEAAQFGELLVLASLWTGTENLIKLAGADRFAGKVVMDTTNPLDFSGGPPPKLAVSGPDSAGERVQRWLPKARVVKAFNIVGNAFMVDPKFPGGVPDMFIAGNDDAAKRTVTEIITSFGWPAAIDIGGIEGARYLEAMAMVWILHGFRTNTWSHAFKLLKK